MRAKPKQKERGGAGEPKKPAKPRRMESTTRRERANNPKPASQLKRRQTRATTSPKSRAKKRGG